MDAYLGFGTIIILKTTSALMSLLLLNAIKITGFRTKASSQTTRRNEMLDTLHSDLGIDTAFVL